MPFATNRMKDAFSRRLDNALRERQVYRRIASPLGRTPLAQNGQRSTTTTTQAPAPVPSNGDLFAARLKDATAKLPNGSAATAAQSAADGSSSSSVATGGPVGSGEHVVAQGQCVLSIADETGHLWETLWDDAANAELRRARGNAGVLLPGDRVAVPQTQKKVETGNTELRHRFIVQGAPAVVRVRLLDDDQPLANVPYVLETPTERFEGTTDAGGHLEHEISGNADRCRLVLNGTDEHVIRLGHLDPVDSISGVQGRLNNLGFDCGQVDGILGPATCAALERFQTTYGLSVTGEADAVTQQKLGQIHDTDAIR